MVTKRVLESENVTVSLGLGDGNPKNRVKGTGGPTYSWFWVQGRFFTALVLLWTPQGRFSKKPKKPKKPGFFWFFWFFRVFLVFLFWDGFFYSPGSSEVSLEKSNRAHGGTEGSSIIRAIQRKQKML